ncbi:MAG: hypothetical protein EBT09_01580 [Actinobacteria bacterium]|nr:hypothetical protein [Actinomycetota bacterium]
MGTSEATVRQPSGLPTFVLADSSIRGDGGHHREYAVHVLQAALDFGMRATVFTATSVEGAFPHGVSVVPTFADDAWVRLARRLMGAWPGVVTSEPAGTSRDAPARPHPLVRAMRGAMLGVRAAVHRWRRARELRHALATIGSGLPDLVFVPSVSGTELGALDKVFTGSRANCLRIVIRRLEDLTFAGGRGSARTAVRRLSKRGALFYCDTEQLCAHVEAVCGVRPSLIPIPIPPFPKTEYVAKSPVVAYLGDARVEKGFLHLPGIVRALVEHRDVPSDVRFVIQAASTARDAAEVQALARARQSLLAIDHRRVNVIHVPLPTEAYHRLIQEAAIVFLPYDAVAYADRSSGVFADALACGVAPIVPCGTWMADQLLRVGPKGSDGAPHPMVTDLVVSSPLDFPRAVTVALGRASILRDLFGATTANWRTAHSAEAVLRTIGAGDGGLHGQSRIKS